MHLGDERVDRRAGFAQRGAQVEEALLDAAEEARILRAELRLERLELHVRVSGAIDRVAIAPPVRIRCRVEEPPYLGERRARRDRAARADFAGAGRAAARVCPSGGHSAQRERAQEGDGAPALPVAQRAREAGHGRVRDAVRQGRVDVLVSAARERRRRREIRRRPREDGGVRPAPISRGAVAARTVGEEDALPLGDTPRRTRERPEVADRVPALLHREDRVPRGHGGASPPDRHDVKEVGRRLAAHEPGVREVGRLDAEPDRLGAVPRAALAVAGHTVGLEDRLAARG
jgi:hypothetical protein